MIPFLAHADRIPIAACFRTQTPRLRLQQIVACVRSGPQISLLQGFDARLGVIAANDGRVSEDDCRRMRKAPADNTDRGLPHIPRSVAGFVILLRTYKQHRLIGRPEVRPAIGHPQDSTGQGHVNGAIIIMLLTAVFKNGSYTAIGNI